MEEIPELMGIIAAIAIIRERSPEMTILVRSMTVLILPTSAIIATAVTIATGL